MAKSAFLEAEKVEIILSRLSLEFDAILTLASFSTESLSLQKLIHALLEFESHQNRVATEALLHANLVETTPSTLVADSVRECYYRFDHDYGGPFAPAPTMAAVFSSLAGNGLCEGGLSDGWCPLVHGGLTGFARFGQYLGNTVEVAMEFPYGAA
ncbi:hypothetical protein J1N35_025359 [Gossypium stocksii]|uniref:Uncharacterized protein n=1 Tax=Gossypium stocksii TaxID=47602 RepID=A0A9D3V6G7_9ROSI|nr:hypothetical protein J1N35_025359 [Gossypium stocksii]